MISCSPYILRRSTCSQGLRLPRITVKVSLIFFNSVSQFDNALIVSQMLIIDETLSKMSRKISLPNCFQCFPVYHGCSSGCGSGSCFGFQRLHTPPRHKNLSKQQRLWQRKCFHNGDHFLIVAFRSHSVLSTN